MTKIDRRIQRTYRALMDALVILALEKRYDSISIRDITDRANVSYSTFFRHFREKDDLLIELLRSVVIELERLIEHNPDKSREAEGLLIFQHIAANQAFFRVLFSSQGTSRIVQDIQETIAADMLRTIPFAHQQIVPPEIIANHAVATIMALVRWWLDHNMPYSVEEMSVIYSKLIGQGLQNLMINPSPA